MKKIEDYPVAPPKEKILTNYKFSLGIHDEDESLLAKKILESKWTLNDREERDEKVDPKMKKEICNILAEHIVKTITSEFIEELINSVNKNWRE